MAGLGEPTAHFHPWNNLMAFVELENVGRTYTQASQQVVALDAITFTLEAGEFVVVTGESGAGKSTLLSLIGALDKPTCGRVCVADTDLSASNSTDLAKFRLRNIGFVFQDSRLVRHLTALANVRLPLLFSRRQNNSNIAESILRRFNMEKRLAHRPESLSRGEQQRVALARALVNAPRLLLADEPTANLDGRNARIIWECFAELNRCDGLTIVSVTHSHKLAPGVTRVLELDNGNLVSDRRL